MTDQKYPKPRFLAPRIRSLDSGLEQKEPNRGRGPLLLAVFGYQPLQGRGFTEHLLAIEESDQILLREDGQ